MFDHERCLKLSVIETAKDPMQVHQRPKVVFGMQDIDFRGSEWFKEPISRPHNKSPVPACWLEPWSKICIIMIGRRRFRCITSMSLAGIMLQTPVDDSPAHSSLTRPNDSPNNWWLTLKSVCWINPDESRPMSTSIPPEPPLVHHKAECHCGWWARLILLQLKRSM